MLNHNLSGTIYKSTHIFEWYENHYIKKCRDSMLAKLFFYLAETVDENVPFSVCTAIENTANYKV